MTEKNLFQRINDIMGELDYIQKGAKRVNNQYTYVSHDAVSAALHPLLAKHGIAVIPSVTKMEQNGNTTIAEVAITFVNVDKPEDRFAVSYTGYGIDNSDKGPGKAISYACKYAMLKVFVLETGDDPDHDQESVPADEHPAMKPKLATDAEVSAFVKSFGADAAMIVKYFEELKETQGKTFNELVVRFQSNKDKATQAFEKWKAVQ